VRQPPRIAVPGLRLGLTRRRLPSGALRPDRLVGCCTPLQYRCQRGVSWPGWRSA
jgi:hypothetical protein